MRGTTVCTVSAVWLLMVGLAQADTTSPAATLSSAQAELESPRGEKARPLPTPITQYGLAFERDISVGKPGEVEIGDVDGDGLDDLVFDTRNGAPTDTGNLFAIVLRTEDGDFASPQLFPSAPSGWFHNVTLVDLDGDGVKEIVASTDQGIAIVRHAAGGMFSLDRVAGTHGASRGVGIADVNGDGVPDIVTLNASSLSVYLGNGAAGISGQSSFPVVAGDALVMADLDADGRDDAAIQVTHGSGVPTLAVYPNNGLGGFGNGVFYTLGYNAWASAIAAGDFDSDGMGDVTLVRGDTTVGGPYSLWLLRQLYPATLLTYTIGSDEPLRGLRSVDLNQDGTTDLVSLHTNGRLGWWLQRRGQLGTEQIRDIPGTGDVAFGELFSDGCADAAVVNANKVSLYRGTGCSIRY